MKRYALILLAALWGTAGCAGIDQVGRKLDMASTHMGSAKPVYVGHLESAKHVGAMVALHFTDGKEIEVAECPVTLLPGDIVRIYKTENGYAAHLWSSSQNQM